MKTSLYDMIKQAEKYKQEIDIDAIWTAASNRDPHDYISDILPEKLKDIVLSLAAIECEPLYCDYLAGNIGQKYLLDNMVSSINDTEKEIIKILKTEYEVVFDKKDDKIYDSGDDIEVKNLLDKTRAIMKKVSEYTKSSSSAVTSDGTVIEYFHFQEV